MTLSNMYTASGARIHIHFGSKTTTNLWGPWVVVNDMTLLTELKACYSTPDFEEIRKKHLNDFKSLTVPYVRNRPTSVGAPAPAPTSTVPTSTDPSIPDVTPAQASTADPIIPDATPDVVPDDVKCKARIDAVKDLQKFFSEFKFNPAARFVNTFARQPDIAAARKYLACYVKLINHSDSADIIEKSKSIEFSTVTAALLTYPPEKKINNRLDIYFGDAGTGKTTEAIAEYPEADVVPCNSSMLPDELMRVFDFNDENGNPVFKPSSLRLAMEAGKPIIFDEINLLSFECLRLLQTLTDNKPVVHYNNEAITIKDGFKVVGTMNLTVNDQVYNLPEPLVDRAETLKEFKLSAKDLAAYAF